MTIVLFVVSLLVIAGASELFTNAIEWAGYRLGLGAGATGSLLAAFGTSLPELTVPVVALATHAPNANAVAMGAVIGAPMLLLGLGGGITGLAVMLRRSRPEIRIAPGQGRRDLGVFLVGFSLTALAAVTSAPPAIRIPLGIFLLALYCGYAVATVRSSMSRGSMPEPLHIIRWDADREAGRWAISAQLLFAIALLVGGSDLFVAAINDSATALHINALLLAVILVPVATELPETMNSILWIRSGNDELAFGNVAGSATFQACVLGFIGVTFTTWTPGIAGFISAAATLVTAVFLLALLHDGRTRGKWLALAAVPWFAYLAIAIATGGRLASGAG